ncbi:uncharacterized protein C8R40DRAFT_1094051 [Lentinula edodes]|uniref:uncharacterized protein n=1 Tax=Lentinula edodes TaxID=5353 RepID=UPI001E8EAD52|nr:uncharacterized protein C8R40DRAFT_1094051 [Lentinula edodes]KAH7877499.1 hypothetical protein C8R40DRAFT_1094051 [Lentinula edodes]
MLGPSTFAITIWTSLTLTLTPTLEMLLRILLLLLTRPNCSMTLTSPLEKRPLFTSQIHSTSPESTLHLVLKSLFLLLPNRICC